ncbi:MAG: fibronectin type III domain-containing protein [Ruminococcaceae bacterium]|nr:fibronectin type III domain-containing protein [Oscillospiraceae bacterium]
MKKALVSVLSLVLALCMLGSSMSAFADGWDTDPVCLEHSYSRVLVEKASLSKDGYTALQCSTCHTYKAGSEQRIAQIASVSLEQEEFFYDETEKKPAVIVKDVDGNTVAPQNYTVEYFDNIYVGRDTYAQVTFKGNYEGTVKCPFVITWDTEPVPCIDHSFVRTVMQKATATQDGYTAMLCSNCQAVEEGSEEKIARIASVSLSKSTYSYDAKEKKPAVTAKDAAGNVIAASNYTVKYYNNVKVGQNTYALITFTGISDRYDAAYKRTFTISLAKPVVKATTGTNAVKLSWAKVPGAKYYRIYVYSASKYKRVANTSSLSYTIKNLKAGTKYVYLVRAYYVNAAKAEVLSPFTVSDNVAAVTLCKAPAVKASVSGKKVTLKWGAVAGAKYYRIYRYNTKTKKYTSLATNIKTLSYALKNQPKGTNYYLVRAYNSAGGGSAYNTKILAKAAVR